MSNARLNVGMIDVQSCVDGLNELRSHVDQAGWIEAIEQEDPDRANTVALGMEMLTPEEIIEHFDSNALLWATLNAGTISRNELLHEVVEKELGYDKFRIQLAEAWEWRTNGNKRFRNVMRQFMLADSVLNGVVGDIDLASILVQTAKEDVELSEERLSDSALQPLSVRIDRTTSYNNPFGFESTYGRYNPLIPDKEFGIYLDSPTGIALMYKGIPQAVVASVAEKDSDSIRINQIQGVKGKRYDPSDVRGGPIGTISSRGLAVLDWKATMTEIGIELARQTGQEGVIIQGGRNNKWTRSQHRDEPAHITVAQAQQTYDTVAKQLDFTQHDNGNWYRDL